MDLVVVRSHHHEIPDTEPVPATVLVRPGRTDQAADFADHQLGLLLALGRTIGVLGFQPAQTGAELGVLYGAARMAGQTTFVDLFRDEPTDVGVHSTGLSEEDASIEGHGGLIPQHVLEHTEPSSMGVGGLGHLRELQRISQQDEVLGRPGGGQGIGQGQLARFVDDQHIDG